MQSRTQTGRVWRLGLASLVAVGLVFSAGCSGREVDTGESSRGSENHEVSQFAIVTPEKESDYGWNQQGLRAAEAAAQELGVALDENSNVGYDNTETILTQIAENDNDLVIAHASGFNAAGHRVGQATGVPTLVVDFDKNEPGTVGTVITHAHEGAYLAGVAAAMKTQTRTVGIVASAENLNWFLMAGGFAQGVASIDPSITVVLAYVGPAAYGDSAGGTAVTNQVLAAGADVIMGMGDGATIGYLQAIENSSADYPISYIATIGDVSAIVDKPEIVLTSVIWDFSDTYIQAIRDVESGTFGTVTYELTVENGGLSLQASENMSEEIVAAVDAAKAQIIAGDVVIERTTDKQAVQAMIDNQ